MEAHLKHKLVVTEEGQSPLHLCDVVSYEDSKKVEHGVASKIEVATRRFTPDRNVKHHPRFVFTPRKGEAARLAPFLDRLRKLKQAAVVILNKRGWIGYLVPHDADPKMYCHYEHQAHMDVQARKSRPPRMAHLAPITRGPWTRSISWQAPEEDVDGPDYDPAVVYTMDELDPYLGLPPAEDDAALPVIEASPEEYEGSAFVNVPRGEVDRTAHRSNGEPMSAQAQAAAKYGEELRTEAQQASSFIYHLKRFNNWVKATLISKASKTRTNAGLRVLDLACGKGGDLGKWAAHPDGIEQYVGSDIAFGSLEHLVERMAKSVEKSGRTNWRKTPVKLFEADLGRNDVQHDKVRVWENNGAQAGQWGERVPLKGGDLFDVASIQFALHYMGESEGRMRRFLHEVSRHLRVGGIFIATTMDSRVLIQLLMGHAEASWDAGRGCMIRKVDIEDERKHNLLSISFKDPPETYLRKQSQDRDNCGPFGLEYTFTLRETELNKNAVDELPEWMLPLETLKDVALEYGLELETAQNFHEFFANESQVDPARQNLRNMHVFNPKGTMNETEWRIAGIYMALVFRKSSKDMLSVESTTPRSPSRPPPLQYPPASPEGPPPEWEGPPPAFPPKSPDHPPPTFPSVGGASTSTGATRIPQSPEAMGVFDSAPSSPTSPPPDDDSDEDDAYDRALTVARSAVPATEWDSFSPEKKKARIEAEMRSMS